MALIILFVSPFPNSNLITQPKPVGMGSYNFLGQKVFDATCYAPNGKYQSGKEVALSLKYNVKLTRGDIVNASITEISRQGKFEKTKLEKWRVELKKIMVDVKKGDTISGIRDKNGFSHFYKNGEFKGKIIDQEFGTHFFNIWLGEKTSQPELRKKLLGLN